MNHEVPHDEYPETFREYKETKASEYSGSRLSHYFNSELGIASNLIGTLHARLNSYHIPTNAESAIASQLNEIIEHLRTVHEIANASFELLITKEDSEN
jgi:hypothetical protein